MRVLILVPLISMTLIFIILTPISQYPLTFLTPKKEEYFYQGGVPPVTEKLCTTWSGLISSLKPFVRLRKEPRTKYPLRISSLTLSLLSQQVLFLWKYVLARLFFVKTLLFSTNLPMNSCHTETNPQLTWRWFQSIDRPEPELNALFFFFFFPSIRRPKYC